LLGFLCTKFSAQQEGIVCVHLGRTT